MPRLTAQGLQGLAVAWALAASCPAMAQTVEPCGDFRSQAAAVAEPWEANTAVFSNGKVRLAVTDVQEPAAGAVHLVVLSPPYSELGDRQCRVLSMGDGLGFGSLSLQGLTADYSPQTGLVLAIPASRFDPASGGFPAATLHVILNQATGVIRARLTAP